MSVQRLYKSCYWKHLLTEKKFTAASVASMPTAPLSHMWSPAVVLGTVVEVQNSNSASVDDQIAYWWASIVDVRGYFVKLRYFGREDDFSDDFWMNITSTTGEIGGIDYDVHPVGWCVENGKKIQPSKQIEDLQRDWKSYVANKLLGCSTIPKNLQYEFLLACRSKFRPGMKLEAVDIKEPSSLAVVIVEQVIGRRLKVVYTEQQDSKTKDTSDFWFHELSHMIHPVGWAKLHGQQLRSSQQYQDTCVEKILTDTHEDDEASFECFAPLRILDCQKKSLDEHKLEVGMKLEVFAYNQPNVMSVGTIREVLRNSFVMIEVDDDNDSGTRSNQMCFHISSNRLYPAGYAQMVNIKLKKPSGYQNRRFRWKEYLEDTKSVAAPTQLFLKVLPNHSFETGQFVEATDLLSPQNICVARIQRIVDRLLLIHFEGFPCKYDQWVDCESPDINPIGWCHSVNYRLSAPGENVR